MNFSRSLILVAGTALLAACGDKVTVTQYTPPATVAKVYSVDVAPATATVNTGASLTFTAAVNADAGVATTVTWTASAGTVTSAGVFTAPSTASAGIAVCATSTVDTGKKGCATVVVSPPVATIPATVSINSIQNNGVAGGQTTNLANVVGAIDITLNVNPGNQTVSKIVLVVGGVRTDSQTYTAAQAAAMRYAADEAVANQTIFPQIVFTVNTAKYNATTGIPAWYNGTQNVSAQLYTAQGGSTTAATATAQTSMTFNNANTYVLSTSGTTSAISAANGYKYSTGSIAATVMPVIYTSAALQMASGNITFGVAGCDATGPRTLALTVATGQGTVTFTKATGAASAADFKSYELRTALCGSLNTGEGFTLTAMDNVGNQLFAAAAPANNAANLYRMDNVAPAAPVITANPNGRANNWMNDAVSFNTVVSASNPNGLITAAITDAGIGGVTYAARAGDYSAGTVAASIAAADQTTPAALAASATNTAYCVVVYSVDALGNRTASPTSTTACAATTQSTPLGVDRAAPTIAYGAAAIAANSRFAAAPAAEFTVTVNDTGLVGNSGMLPAAPVKGTVIFRGNGNTAAQACFVGTIVSSVCTANTLAGAAPNWGTTTMAATPGNTVATEGYYTFTATAYDAAGNSATVAARTTLVDATAATVGVASAPLSSTTYTFPVSALVNENLDIQSYYFNANYAGAVGPFTAPLTLPQGTTTAVNGYNAATFINTNYTINTTFNLPVAIQANMAAGLTAVTGVTATATNQANTNTTGGASGVPVFGTAATAITIPASWLTFPVAALPAGITGVSSGVTTAAVAAKPLSSTLSVTTTGTTAVFNNPFARVDFYALNVAGTAWVPIGSTTASTLTDDGSVRTFTYSIPVSGATLYTALGAGATVTQNVIAFGFKADGSVAMVNAAAFGLNIVK